MCPDAGYPAGMLLTEMAAGLTIQQTGERMCSCIRFILPAVHSLQPGPVHESMPRGSRACTINLKPCEACRSLRAGTLGI